MDDILDILVAHGVPGTTIVRVAKLIADAQQNQERRARNTERMRTVRTRAHNGVHTNAQKCASLSIPPITQTVGSKGVRGTRLPDDWQPDADDCVYAIDRGLDPQAVAIDFRGYWHARAGPGALKVKWKLTWERWCRTEKKGNGNGANRRSGEKTHSISAAFDDIFDRLKRGDKPSVVPFKANPRLLPDR